MGRKACVRSGDESIRQREDNRKRMERKSDLRRTKMNYGGLNKQKLPEKIEGRDENRVDKGCMIM